MATPQVKGKEANRSKQSDRHLGATLGLGEGPPHAPCAPPPLSEMAPRASHSNSLTMSGASARSAAMIFLPSGPVTLRQPRRAFVRRHAPLGLLLHCLARFLGQVVDIVLRHRHLDAVHELLRGAPLARAHHGLAGDRTWPEGLPAKFTLETSFKLFYTSNIMSTAFIFVS